MSNIIYKDELLNPIKKEIISQSNTVPLHFYDKQTEADSYRGYDSYSRTTTDPLIYENILSDEQLDKLENKDIYSDKELTTMTPETYEDIMSDTQTVVGNIYRGAARTINKATAETIKMVGTIGGLGMYAITGFEDEAWIFNNKFNKAIDQANNYINEHGLKVYTPSDVANGSLLRKLGSSSFYAQDLADGAGFMASMFVPGAALKGIGFGAKVARGGALMSDMVNAESKVLQGIGKATKFLGKTSNKIGKIARLEKVKPSTFIKTKAMKVGNIADAEAISIKRLADNIDMVAGAALNTTFESVEEAHGVYQDVYNKYKDILGEDEANRLAADRASATFRSNYGILLLPNMLEQKFLFGRFKPKKNILKSIYQNPISKGDGFISKIGRAINAPLHQKAGLAKKALLIAGTESFWEEGLQFATSTYYTNKPISEEESNFLPEVGGILNTYVNSLSDIEMQTGMALGAILGGGMGSISNYRQYKQARNIIEGKSTKKPNKFKRAFNKAKENKYKRKGKEYTEDDAIFKPRKEREGLRSIIDKAKEGVTKDDLTKGEINRILNESGISSNYTAGDLFEFDNNGNIVLDPKTGLKFKVNEQKGEQLLRDNANLRVNTYFLEKAYTENNTEYFESLLERQRYNQMSRFLGSEAAIDLYKSEVLKDKAEDEVKLLNELNNEEGNETKARANKKQADEQIKYLTEKIDQYKKIHDLVDNNTMPYLFKRPKNKEEANMYDRFVEEYKNARISGYLNMNRAEELSNEYNEKANEKLKKFKYTTEEIQKDKDGKKKAGRSFILHEGELYDSQNSNIQEIMDENPDVEYLRVKTKDKANAEDISKDFNSKRLSDKMYETSSEKVSKLNNKYKIKQAFKERLENKKLKELQSKFKKLTDGTIIKNNNEEEIALKKIGDDYFLYKNISTDPENKKFTKKVSDTPITLENFEDELKEYEVTEDKYKFLNNQERKDVRRKKIFDFKEDINNKKKELEEYNDTFEKDENSPYGGKITKEGKLTQAERELKELEEELKTIDKSKEIDKEERDNKFNEVNKKYNEVQKLKDRKDYLQRYIKTAEPITKRDKYNKLLSEPSLETRQRNKQLNKLNEQPVEPNIPEHILNRVEALEKEIKKESDTINIYNEEINNNVERIKDIRTKISYLLDALFNTPHNKRKKLELQGDTDLIEAFKKTGVKSIKDTEDAYIIPNREKIREGIQVLKDNIKEIEAVTNKYERVINRTNKKIAVLENKVNAIMNDIANTSQDDMYNRNSPSRVDDLFTIKEEGSEKSPINRLVKEYEALVNNHKINKKRLGVLKRLINNAKKAIRTLTKLISNRKLFFNDISGNKVLDAKQKIPKIERELKKLYEEYQELNHILANQEKEIRALRYELEAYEGEIKVEKKKNKSTTNNKSTSNKKNKKNKSTIKDKINLIDNALSNKNEEDDEILRSVEDKYNGSTGDSNTPLSDNVDDYAEDIPDDKEIRWANFLNTQDVLNEDPNEGRVFEGKIVLFDQLPSKMQKYYRKRLKKADLNPEFGVFVFMINKNTGMFVDERGNDILDATLTDKYSDKYVFTALLDPASPTADNYYTEDKKEIKKVKKAYYKNRKKIIDAVKEGKEVKIKMTSKSRGFLRALNQGQETEYSNFYQQLAELNDYFLYHEKDKITKKNRNKYLQIHVPLKPKKDKNSKMELKPGFVYVTDTRTGTTFPVQPRKINGEDVEELIKLLNYVAKTNSVFIIDSSGKALMNDNINKKLTVHRLLKNKFLSNSKSKKGVALFENKDNEGNIIDFSVKLFGKEFADLSIDGNLNPDIISHINNFFDNNNLFVNVFNEKGEEANKHHYKITSINPTEINIKDTGTYNDYLFDEVLEAKLPTNPSIQYTAITKPDENPIPTSKKGFVPLHDNKYVVFDLDNPIIDNNSSINDDLENESNEPNDVDKEVKTILSRDKKARKVEKLRNKTNDLEKEKNKGDYNKVEQLAVTLTDNPDYELTKEDKDLITNYPKAFEYYKTEYKTSEDITYNKEEETAEYDSDIENDLFRKRNPNTKDYTLWDKQEELSWLEENIGVGYELLNLINQGTWGIFSNNMIYLDNNAEVGTAYHEAFHAITQVYLSEKQRKELYNEFRNKNKGKKFITFKGTEKSAEYFTNKEVEEHLAEGFRDYKLFKEKKEDIYGSKIRRFFSNLLKIIKNLFRKPDKIQELYKKIDSGKFKYAPKYTSTKTFNRNIYESNIDRHTTPQFANKAAKMLSVFYALALKNKFDSYDNYYERIKQGYPGEAIINEEIKKGIKMFLDASKVESHRENLQFLLDNFDNGKNKIILENHLSKLGLGSITEEFLNSETTETDRGKDTGYDKGEKQYNINPLKNGNAFSKLLLSTIPKFSKRNTILIDEYGFMDFENSYTVAGRILSETKGLKDELKIIDKIIELEKEISGLKFITGDKGLGLRKIQANGIDHLTPERYGEVIKFIQYITKTENNFEADVFGSDNEFNNLKLNEDNKYNPIMTEWKSNASAIKENRPNQFKKGDVYNPNSFTKYLDDKNTKSISDTYKEYFRFLKALGITFTNPSKIIEIDKEISSNSPSILINKIDAIYNQIEKGDQLFIFGNNVANNVKGDLDYFMKLEYESNKQNRIVLSHLNKDRKQTYDYSLNTYLTTIIDEVNNFDTRDELINHYSHLDPEFNHYIKNSEWFKLGGILFDEDGDKIANSTLKLVIDDFSYSTNDKKTVKFKDLNDSDKLIVLINRLLSNNQVNLLKVGDTFIERFIELPEINHIYYTANIKIGDMLLADKSKDTIINLFTNYLKDEITDIIQNIRDLNDINNNTAWKNISEENISLKRGIVYDLITSMAENNKEVKDFKRRLDKSLLNNKTITENTNKDISNYVDKWFADIRGTNNIEIFEDAIVSYMEQSTLELKTILESNNIIKDTGRITHDTMLPIYSNEGLKLDKEIDQDELMSRLITYLLNTFSSNIEQTKILFGNPTMYGSIDNLFKRLKSSQGPLKKAFSSKITDEFIEKKLKRVDKGETIKDSKGNSIIRTMVIDEIVTKSNEITEESFKQDINGIVDENKELTDMQKRLVESYSGLEQADGNSWVTLDFVRDLLYRAGDWSLGVNSLEDLYQWEMQNYYGKNYPELFEAHWGRKWDNKVLVEDYYTITNEPQKLRTREITEAPNKVFNSLKPLYYGPLANVKGHKQGILKTGFSILLPSITEIKDENNNLKYPNYKNMIDYMTANSISIMSMQSANKGATYKIRKESLSDENIPTTNNLYGENKVIDKNSIGLLGANSDNTLYQYLDWKFLGIQLDTGFKFKDKIKGGSQMTKHIFNTFLTKLSNIKDNPELVKKTNYIHSLNKQRIDIGKKMLLNKLGINNKTISDNIDLSRVKAILKEESLKRDLPDNIIDQIDELDNVLGIDPMVQNSQFKYILNSIAGNYIVNQTRNGGAYYQSPSIGFEIFSIEDGTIKGSKNLSFYKKVNKDGKTTVESMEVLLPEIYKGIVDVGEVTDKRLLNVIGFRIPTQGLASIESIKIVGFTSKSHGNTIILPDAIVKKAGSDYDIDKLNLLIPNFYYKNNKPVYIDGNYDNYLDDISDDLFERFKNTLSKEVDYVVKNITDNDLQGYSITDESLLKSTNNYIEKTLAIKDLNLSTKKILSDFTNKINIYKNTGNISKFTNNNTVIIKEINTFIDKLQAYKSRSKEIQEKSVDEKIIIKLNSFKDKFNEQIKKSDPDVFILDKLSSIIKDNITNINESKNLSPYEKKIFKKALYNIKKKLTWEKYLDNQDKLDDGTLLGLLTKDEFTKANIENKMITEYQKLLTNPVIFEEYMTPLDDPFLKDFNNSLYTLLTGNERGTKGFNTMLSVPEMLNLHKNISASKDGIGVAAVVSTFQVLAQLYDIKLDKTITVSENKALDSGEGYAASDEFLTKMRYGLIDVPTKLNFKNHNFDKDGNITFGGLESAGENPINIQREFAVIGNAVVDALKDPHLAEGGNIDMDNLGVFLTLVAQGVPYNEAILFLNQPIIQEFKTLKKEAYTLNNRSNNVFTPLSSIIHRALDIHGTSETINDMGESIRGIFYPLWNNSNTSYKYDAKSLSSSLKTTDKRKTSNKYKEEQTQILSDFFRYSYIANSTRNLIQDVFTYDTKMTKTPEELLVKQFRTIRTLNSGNYINLDKAVSDINKGENEMLSFVSPYMENTLSLLDDYKELFGFLNNEDFDIIIDKFMSIYNNPNSKLPLDKTGNVLSRLIAGYYTFNLIHNNYKLDESNTNFLGSQTNKELKRLFVNDPKTNHTSVIYKIKEIQDRIKDYNATKSGSLFSRKTIQAYNDYGKNALIKLIKPIISSANNDTKYDNLVISSKNNIDILKSNEITYAWEELLNKNEETKKLALDIAKILILQEGLFNSPTNFIDFIPYKIRNTIFKKAMQSNNTLDRKTRVDMLDKMLATFMIDNYNNSDIVPKSTSNNRVLYPVTVKHYQPNDLELLKSKVSDSDAKKNKLKTTKDYKKFFRKKGIRLMHSTLYAGSFENKLNIIDAKINKDNTNFNKMTAYAVTIKPGSKLTDFIEYVAAKVNKVYSPVEYSMNRDYVKSLDLSDVTGSDLKTFQISEQDRIEFTNIYSDLYNQNITYGTDLNKLQELLKERLDNAEYTKTTQLDIKAAALLYSKINKLLEVEDNINPEQDVLENTPFIKEEMNEAKEIENECKGGNKGGNKYKAEKGGKTNFTKGGKWELVKDLKGPSHAQGGIQLSIKDNNVHFTNGDSTIHAANGLIIPNNINDNFV